MSRIHISGFKEKATERQIEELFIDKGRIIFSDINTRKGSGHLEYDDEKCAKNAISELNNTEQFGGTLIVELASNKEDQQRLTHFKRYKYQHSRSRSYSSSRSRSHSHRRTNYRKSNHRQQSPRQRKEPTSRDKCFVCGKYGHWASQCKEGDGTGVSSGKCFRCGEKGHIARNCPNARKRSNYSSRSNSKSRSSSSEKSRRRHRKPKSSSKSVSSNNSSRSKSSKSGSN